MDESNLLVVAKEYAIKKHSGQLYSGHKYQHHLIGVLNMANKFIHLVNEKNRENIFIACWCHDLIEDTDTSYNDLKNKFGTIVAEIVYNVSNELGRNRKERNLKTYSKISNNYLAKFLKLCDRIFNVSFSKTENDDMYGMYKDEYETFKYFLKRKNELEEMWDILDKLIYDENHVL